MIVKIARWITYGALGLMGATAMIGLLVSVFLADGWLGLAVLAASLVLVVAAWITYCEQ